MKAPKRIVTLTSQEQRFIIQGLIEVRNELIKEGKCSNIFDDLLIKIHKTKNGDRKYYEGRTGILVRN